MRSFNNLALFRAWCYLAPLAVAQAAPDPEVSLAPGSPPDPQPNPDGALSPYPESDAALEARSILIRQPPQIPAPPNMMGWLGSIGGVLGIVSFTHSYWNMLMDLIFPDPEPRPDEPWWDQMIKVLRCQPGGQDLPRKKGPPSGRGTWSSQHLLFSRTVMRLDPHGGQRFVRDIRNSWLDPFIAEQLTPNSPEVGLDGAGLKGAGGEFPQICLWNNHGELIGYNDQTIRYVPSRAQDSRKVNFEKAREDMPEVLSGSLKSVGIWPAPHHKDRGYQQAVYVTMIKRHYDAVCIASVFVQWSDNRQWLLDGSWGRASNMSWYYSYVISSDRRDDGTCFWLDARGDLTHKEDLEEEWLATHMGFDKKPEERKKWPYYPDYWWANTVVPETGIPEGDNLNEGMRENGVHEYKVPMGVKFNTIAFLPSEYGPNFNNLTVEDFVTNPGKIHWIMEPSRKNVRGGNPVRPILDPTENDKYTAKHPKLLWEDKSHEEVPVDCMTDRYYDEDEQLVGPPSRVKWTWKLGEFLADNPGPSMLCPHKSYKRRALESAPRDEKDLTPLHKQHARTLVNDQNSRAEGSSTKKLCESPHSVGPSYANHRERFFCRMTDKTLWPFCDSAAGVSHDCFDAEAEILVEKNKPIGKRSHHWDAIEDWHSEKRFKRAA